MRTDFNPCGNEEASGLPGYVFDTLNLKYPDCYCRRDDLVAISKLIKTKENKSYCMLPFDQTLEAQILGGQVRMSADGLGPRLSSPSLRGVDEFLSYHLPKAYPDKVKETMEAIWLLKKDGEQVIFNLVGPMSVLSGILPMERLFVARRKEREQYVKALLKVQEVIIALARSVKEAGCQILSLADPVASKELLGEAVMEELVTKCYLPLFSELEKEGMVVHLCPRMVDALVEYGNLKKEAVPLDSECYVEGILACAKKGQILCGNCIKKNEKDGRGLLYRLRR